MNAIEFSHVSKSFTIYPRSSDRLKELARLPTKSLRFKALQDLSFQVSPGCTFCVIGENGSGKSTLLQIMAGIMQPTSGNVEVKGRVAALLELGSGFNPEFTGRENVYLNASVLGLSRNQIDARFQKIAGFAEIGDFLDEPVRTYSTGMAIRLGFAVAIHAEPTILLVDEALAVGDIYFRQRCLRKIEELRSDGVTVVFVSHSMTDVKAIGDRCLWLESGTIRMIGAPAEVIPSYLNAMAAQEAAYEEDGWKVDPDTPPAFVEQLANIDGRTGDRRAQITGLGVMDDNGHTLGMLEPSTKATIRISVRATQQVIQPSVGFVIRNHLGIEIAETSTAVDGHPLPEFRPGDRFTIDFAIEVPELYPASFSFTPAITDGAAETVCDRVENALTLPMASGKGLIYGYLHWPNRIEVNQRLLKGGSS